MDKHFIPMIGMRKVKSIFALVLSFVLWQLVRIPFPQFEVHPLFGYVYAVIEMRESIDKTKLYGMLRIKSTLIGLIAGICFLFLSVNMGRYVTSDIWISLIDLVIIALGVLVSLVVSEKLKCDSFCGIAAIICIICLVRDRNAEMNIYLYAILRVVQTFIGILSAYVINILVCQYHEKDEEN